MATSRETFLAQQLHALAMALYQSKARGDVADTQALLARFQALADEYRALGGADFTAFDRVILETGKWIKQTLAAVPGAVSALPFAIGQGLLKGALPYLLLGGLGLYAWSKVTR